MAESSWPAGAGTRVTTDSQFEALGAGWSAPGVYGNPGDATTVYADGTGTRVVKVRANKRALIRGWGWWSGPTDISLPSLAANAAGSTRFDTVVLRYSRTTYTVTVQVVQGVAGAGVPALTQSVAEPLTAGTFEVPLATVAVAPGATTISAGSVTNVAWYTDSAGVIIPTGTSAYIPGVAIGINRYRTYDTGVVFELAAGAWRRTPWLTGWGLVGGKRYQSGGTLAAGLVGEAAANMDSGSIALTGGRRYRITGHVRMTATFQDTTIYIRIRETNTSGTIVAYYSTIIRGGGALYDFHLEEIFAVGSDTSKTYVMTVQATASVTITSGSTNIPAGIWVEDIGPSSVTVATVP